MGKLGIIWLCLILFHVNMVFDPPSDQAEVPKVMVTEQERPGAEDRRGEEEGAEGAEEDERALSARPLSGRQARQMRSARIRSAAQGEENVNPDRYTRT